MSTCTDRAGIVIALTVTSSIAFATEESAPAPANDTKGAATVDSFASDGDRLDGDHLKLRVNVAGFDSLDGKKTNLCAPQGSKIKVSRHTSDFIYLFFKSIPTIETAKDKRATMTNSDTATKDAVCKCLSDGMVNDYTQYKIRTDTLNKYSFRRTGVTFGALVVPFKFYLGDDSKLSASSTIAPYIGFRWLAPYDLTFTPVISAGLGLVPVTDATSGETETKSALSTAIGMRVTHTKNEKFNAGLLIGKDFLSRGDRSGDPSVDNLWFSIYAGYSL